MTVIRNAIRRNMKSTLVWSFSIAAMIFMVTLMYPEMKSQMDSVTSMFASMGSFSAAFGLDRLSFGSIEGFFAIECGTMMLLGSSFFAAITAMSSLAGEEKDKSSEFLLTLPLSRVRIALEKLLALFVLLTLMTLLCCAVSIAGIMLTGENIDIGLLISFFVSYYLCDAAVILLTSALSAVVKTGLGLPLGLVLVLYFLNLAANISDKASFFKYITPFSFTEGSDLIAEGLSWKYMVIPMIFSLLSYVLALVYYTRKDIRA